MAQVKPGKRHEKRALEPAATYSEHTQVLQMELFDTSSRLRNSTAAPPFRISGREWSRMLPIGG
jgi:hypothetical protein